jgi:hypothetical protein
LKQLKKARKQQVVADSNAPQGPPLQRLETKEQRVQLSVTNAWSSPGSNSGTVPGSNQDERNHKSFDAALLWTENAPHAGKLMEDVDLMVTELLENEVWLEGYKRRVHPATGKKSN